MNRTLQPFQSLGKIHLRKYQKDLRRVILVLRWGHGARYFRFAELAGIILPVILSASLTAEVTRNAPSGDGASSRITDNEQLHQLYLEGIQQAFNWEYEASKQTFKKILELDADSPAGHFLLGALTLNTMQYFDPLKTKDEEKFVYDSFESAIAKADRVLAKRPEDFQAVFFKGAAHGFRGILRLQKAEFLSAASDARIGKAQMDLAIKLNPKFYDAYMGLGMYNYFMDALPSLIKFLKALLFVPGGDRVKGLEQIELSAEKGTYCSVYAKVVLASIYHNFELDRAKALKFEEEITRDYPDHPWYALERGTILVYSLKDLNRAEAHYKELLQRAASGQLHYQGEIEAVTRYRLAQTKFFNFKPQEAIADLEALIQAAPKEPREIVSGSHLLLGEIYFELGDTARSRQHLLQVKSLPDSKTYRHERMDNRIIIPKQTSLHSRAAKLQATSLDMVQAAAYSLAVQGWTLLREGKFPEAQEKFTAALESRKDYDSAAFGRGEAMAQAGQVQEALSQLQKIAAKNQANPSWLLLEARFRCGLLLDRSGRRLEAVGHYRRAAQTPGGNYFHGLAAGKAAEEKEAWKELGWPKP